MTNQRHFDPKYAVLGVLTILLTITVLVILPNVVRKQFSKIGK